jgi:hypothetical protein
MAVVSRAVFKVDLRDTRYAGGGGGCTKYIAADINADATTLATIAKNFTGTQTLEVMSRSVDTEECLIEIP